MQGKEGNHLNRLAFCTVTICAVLFIFTLAASAYAAVTISGTVYGFNEVTGIAQVTVKCTSGGSVVGQGITNSTGQYSFQVPGGTSCTMTASGPPTGYKYYFVDNPRDIYSIQSDRGGENFIAGYQVWGSVFEVGYSTKIGDVDILCDASGSLRDYRTKSLASGADAGKYFVVLKAGTSCSLSASKAGYAFISSQYKTNYITIGNIGDNMGYEDFINSVSTIPTTHSITGKVYEGTDSSSGTGIYGAVVKCTDTSYQTYQSQSLSDGRYTISGVPHGTICSTVIAEKSGYTFTARTSLTVSSDLSNIDFKGTPNTPATHSISGKVYEGTDSVSGTGISSAVVKCTATSYQTYQSQSGSDGRYTISGVPHGTVCSTVIAEKSGYTFTARTSLTVSSDLSNIDFKGTPNIPVPHSISGKIYEGTDSVSGTGISSAVVKCATSSQTYQSQSGSDGRYTISGVPHGAICSTVIAEKSGYTFTARTSLTVSSDLSNIDFKGTPVPHSISGKVYEGTDSSSGTGIYGAVVKCTTSSQTYQSQSGSDGRYTISGVPHGTICTTVIPEKSVYSFTARTSLTVSSNLSNIDFKGISLHSMILSLVTRYYNDILDRQPEPGGAEGWTAEVERVMALGMDVKEGFIALGKFFFNSNEYLAKRKTNAAFVVDLYQAFLNRTPGQSEVEYWVGYLTQGLSRSVILNSFAYSAECSLYMDGIFGAGAKRPEPNLVNDFYRGLLNRLPDTAGFNSYLALMRTAQCSGPQQVRDLSGQVALGFLGSAEYTLCKRTNAQFVEDLYNGILRRGAVPEEINYWVNFLDSGTYNREQELAFFTSSDEFQLRVQEVIEAGCLSF